MLTRVLVAVSVLFVWGSNIAEAKRVIPDLAVPLRYGPYELRASVDPKSMGTVEIWNLKDQTKVRDIKVYHVFIRPWLEADVQWIFIKSMSLDWPILTVVNEKGRAYKVRVDRYLPKVSS